MRSGTVETKDLICLKKHMTSLISRNVGAKHRARTTDTLTKDNEANID